MPPPVVASEPGKLRVHPTAQVAESVVALGDGVVGPGCDIGDFGFQRRDYPRLLRDNVAPARTELGPGAVIRGLSVIGCGTRVGRDLRCDFHSCIGEDCEIGDEVVIQYGARVYDRVVIGSNSIIGGFVCNDSRIGQGCVVQGSLVHARTAPAPEPAPIIEDGVLVGAGAVVVGGVTVGRGCVVAAGAVLIEDAAPGGLYAGVPADRVGTPSWP
jgi:acetyltransferase-like isoleucine patch superfamily enzyme